MPARMPVPLGTAARLTENEYSGYPYDVESAKALLEGAGWVDRGAGVREKAGKKLESVLWIAETGDINNREFAEAVQLQLAKIGMKLEISVLERSAFFLHITAKQAPIYIAGFTWGADAAARLDFLATTGKRWNCSDYANPLYDLRLGQAAATGDPQERLALLKDAQRMLMDDAIWVPLYYTQGIYLYRSYLKGFGTDGMENVLVKDAWLEERQ